MLYDPVLARFAQADTKVPDPGKSHSFDRYAYANNNPVLYNDPSGHDVDCGAYDSACRAQVKQEQYWSAYTSAVINYYYHWLPVAPAFRRYYEPHNYPAAEKQSGNSGSKPANDLIASIKDAVEVINWTMQPRENITLYETAAYRTVGGFRIYGDFSTGVDNGSSLTMGLINGKISLARFSIGPTNVIIRGSFQTGRSSAVPLIYFANSTLNTNIPNTIVDPWSLNISASASRKLNNTANTVTLGFEYVARPDNLSYIPGTALVATGIYAAFQNPSSSQQLLHEPYLQY